jgi:hypothetical protein
VPGVRRPCAILAATLGALAGCTRVDDTVSNPYRISVPPAAVLGSPSRAAPPVDPRFADALIDYVGAVRELPAHRGFDADEHIREALRRLALAVALVPARPELRQPAFSAANELRATVGRMAGDHPSDPRVHTELAQQGLIAVSQLLLRVAADYPGAPDVLDRASVFAAAARAIDPARVDPERRQVIAALAHAEELLDSMLRAVVRAAPG